MSSSRLLTLLCFDGVGVVEVGVAWVDEEGKAEGAGAGASGNTRTR